MNEEKAINRLWKSGLISILSALFFSFYNGYLGIFKHYAFGLSIGIYYFLLSSIRFILYIINKNKTNKKRYFLINVLLLALNISLIAPIIMMIDQKRNYNFGLIHALTIATYATYKIISAIILFYKTKERTYQSQLMRNSVNLIDALVSILTLQDTLIIVNGAIDDNNMHILMICSSIAIYIIILAISFYTYLKVRKQKREDK